MLNKMFDERLSLKKALLHKLFEKISHGGMTVQFWDGEQVNYGPQAPWFKLIFNKSPEVTDAFDDPILYFGEAYMDEVIDIEGDWPQVLRLIERNKHILNPKPLEKKIASGITSFCQKDKEQQKMNIHHHYDLGNDFFSMWLDKTMSYSCAYFKNHDDDLYKAQLQKIDYILKKLNLHSNEKLLDIGSGWGWLIIRAAQQYDVQAAGITLSQEQYEESNKRISEFGLTGKVTVKLGNYLDLDEDKYQFDKIVSVGMFEHVGKENLSVYMDKVHKLLVPGGLSLLHTITGSFEEEPNTWIRKYIFPGGYIPSLREIIWLMPQYDFHMLHMESLRLHYAKTLDCWYDNFKQHMDAVEEKYGRRFVRMWELYLKGCAAAFRSTGLDIHQFAFTKGLNNNLPWTYDFLYK